jgi:hypothetical protein
MGAFIIRVEPLEMVAGVRIELTLPQLMRLVSLPRLVPAIVKRTKLTEIEHQPTFVVKPFFMETISIPIDQLLKEAPNHTINELADKYSTDYGTIYRILARYKVEAAKAHEPLTKEVLEAVFDQPTTITEAAEQLHVTVGTVSSAIKKFGLFGGGRKPVVKDKFVGFRAFKVLGYLLNHPEESLASIGRRFNCTREYVRQVKECGVSEGIIKQQEGVEL